MTDKLRYHLLTGPDDKSFCERISSLGRRLRALWLDGSPAVTYDGERVIAAQALILKAAVKRSTGSQRRARSRSATQR